MDVRDNCFERNRYETEAYSSKMWWLCSERKYSVSFHAAARISFCAFEAACVSSPLLSGEHCISQFRNRRPSIWRDLCAPEMLLWYSISQTHRGFRDKQRRRRSANFDTADRLAFERSNTHPAYYGGYAIALSSSGVNHTVCSLSSTRTGCPILQIHFPRSSIQHTKQMTCQTYM